MIFEQIIGNEEVKCYIRKNIEQSNILHSYLFLGTEGIGKLLLAKEFAKHIVKRMCMKRSVMCIVHLMIASTDLS